MRLTISPQVRYTCLAIMRFYYSGRGIYRQSICLVILETELPKNCSGYRLVIYTG